MSCSVSIRLHNTTLGVWRLWRVSRYHPWVPDQIPFPMNSSSFSEPTFDWPLAYEAEQLLSGFIEAFLLRNTFARRLADRMGGETGTNFYEWVDHFTVSPSHEQEFITVGFEQEQAERPSGTTILRHPKAMMPRVLVTVGGSAEGAPTSLAIRTESVVDFLARQGLVSKIEGGHHSLLRRARVSEENGTRFEAVEHLGGWSIVPRISSPGIALNVSRARELLRLRKRDFPHEADGVRHAFDVQRQAIGLAGRDVACDLFFAEERVFWEFRNKAARTQKRRQDALGLGWANHDHHTFRCSRRFFADAVAFFQNFGFKKRERYYAGAEAGWGAQIMEQATVGIVVFADVDLMPDEVAIDFSTQRLPDAPKLGTVGLWCGLHGDSLLQAGMHHLEARFDFPRLRDQLAAEGIATMKPFSDLPFLKQAFTEGERWPVDPLRAEKLLSQGLITRLQFDSFVKDGAIGSHLENLQRKGGFKGFNQKSVSVIISATDPRKIQEVASA